MRSIILAFLVILHITAVSEDKVNRVAVANGSKYYQTAVIAFKKGEHEVHFYCSIHIGQKTYYETLNKWFKNYDAVLFEKVIGFREALKQSGVKGDVWELIAGKLNLATQLTGVNYKAENFVHADLTWKELKERAEKKKIPLNNVLNPQKMQQVINSLKQAPPQMVKQLYRSTFKKQEIKDPLIIQERNAKCLEVLKTQLKDKKKLAVFFGSGHFQNMKKRLEEEGFEQQKLSWITVFKE